ncbi:MAG: DUF2252 domain-containing protein [Burkholderiales bacterium]|nr:MAG: DUF2252 domain-containing protein [Burkholderiales bacterium]
MDIVKSILDDNAGRDPERLRIKLAKMRASPFSFLRGTAHLFHARVRPRGALKTAPPAWCCGDLHLENFGSYKGDNRLAYFDLNDFDEAALAPAAWDPLRLLTSLWVAADELKLPPAAVAPLARQMIDAYADALATGKAYWVERDTASGPVRDLLTALGDRQRADFLARRCEPPPTGRGFLRLRVDGKKALAASRTDQQQVRAFMQHFASTQAHPGFYKVLDVARRIAGTGSLGLRRFIILVRGKGGPHGHYLLDLKEIRPSVLAPVSPCPQPRFADEAVRVVAAQTRMQAVPMAFLQPVRLDGRPFVLRGLQPSEDRLDLAQLAARPRDLADALQTMARLTAWAQLRASGRQGSATADELMDFGRRGAAPGKWRDRLVETARITADQVRADWRDYSQAFDEGALEVGA